jgi:aspartate kinase
VAIVVQKYGGSSVEDVAKMRLVADRVARLKATGSDVVVVVSAMGHTTDDLLALARQVAPNPARRELDMLLSAGERISMALLSIALNERGVAAVSFTGSQSGIITNDSHVDARIVEVRPFRVQDELAKGRVVIVAGYQGVSYRKEITTLGRGGSDTTAVALAAALDAEACEIYSDVPGVFSADPRVVPDAHLLPELSYEEMQELAEHGARVLNAQAVEFAKKRGIAIYARAASGAGGETVVRRFPPRTPGSIVGIASESGLVRVTLKGAQLAEFLDVFQSLDTGGKELLTTFTGPGFTSVVLSLDNLHAFATLRSQLLASFGAAVAFDEGIGSVSAIGAGINARYANLQKALRAAARNGVTPLGVSTSSFRFSLLVAGSHVEPLVRTLHAELIGPAALNPADDSGS